MKKNETNFTTILQIIDSQFKVAGVDLKRLQQIQNDKEFLKFSFPILKRKLSKTPTNKHHWKQK